MIKQNIAYLEVLATFKHKDKTIWTRIGAAFPTTDGKGFKLKLNFVPKDPETEILVMPPKLRDIEE